MAGIFITLEGAEACGKSTHADRLCGRLREEGHDIVALHEPGGTRLSEALRDIVQFNAAGEAIAPETEALLFAASRAQLVREVIVPALDRGVCVVCDRFADSTTAYQGYGRGFDVETILRINAFATGGLEPDLTILLDLDMDIAFERMRDRTESGAGQTDRIEQEARDFHDRVRNGYLALAARWPERFVVVDTVDSEDAVADAIWTHVTRRLAAAEGEGL